MQREIHVHGGHRYQIRATYIRGKIDTLPGSRLKPGLRTRWLKAGTFCFYCGFTFSDFAKRLQRQALQRHIRGE